MTKNPRIFKSHFSIIFSPLLETGGSSGLSLDFYFLTFFLSMKKNLIRDARVKAKLSLREAVVESQKHDDEAEGLSLTTLARLEKQEGKKPLHPRTARILSKMYGIEYDDLYS